jgi:uncharacterized protein
MHWAQAVVMVIAAVGTFAAGVRIVQRSRKAAAWVLLLLFPLLMARGIFVPFPAAVCSLIPYSWYAVIHPWWGFYLAFLFFGIGAAYAHTRPLRSACCASALLLAVTFHLQVIGAARFSLQPFTGTAKADRTCEQTTSYSCGPAAAATLCAQMGVDTSEREMALLCRTNTITGTDRVNAYWGLRRKLARTPWTVKMKHASWDELLSERRPVMVVFSFDIIWDHWLVVLKATRDYVLLADPACGVRRMASGDFLKLWTGEALVIRPALRCQQARLSPAPDSTTVHILNTPVVPRREGRVVGVGEARRPTRLTRGFSRAEAATEQCRVGPDPPFRSKTSLVAGI